MKKVFVWSSPHKATQEQLDSLESRGSVLLLSELAPELFNEISNLTISSDLDRLARKLVSLLVGVKDTVLVQPAGSPALQAVLGGHLESRHIDRQVWYAFSKRISQDIEQADGTIKKVAIFKHEGWVKV